MDIKLTNNDLSIQNGDFELTEAPVQQNIDLILQGAKGDFKNAPRLGANIRQYLNAPFNLKERNAIQKNIRRELERDGIKVQLLNFDGQKGSIQGSRNDDEDNQYADLSAVPKTLWDHFYIQISDDEGTVNPNDYRRIYLNLGTYYSIDQQYAYPDEDGYEPLNLENELIKVRVDDSLTDYIPGLVRGDFLFIDEQGQAHELKALPICFVVPS